MEVVLPKYDCINYNLVQDLKWVLVGWGTVVGYRVWTKGRRQDLNWVMVCRGLLRVCPVCVGCRVQGLGSRV